MSTCCDSCQSALAPPSVHVIYWTLPCLHRLCADCFTGLAFSHNSECPCSNCSVICNKISRTYYQDEAASRSRTRSRTRHSNGSIVLEADTKWTEFPLQAVPTLTLKIPGESYSTVPLTEATTDDPENTSTLKKIFARLHFILLPSKTQIEIPVDTKGTIEEILERMVNSDDSALNHCLRSLATGQDDGSLPPTSNLNLSTQIFMAAENLRQAMNPSGSELRRLVNRALTAFSNNTNSLISIFQKLGACYSRQNQSRLQACKVDKLKADFLVNVKINKYCYAIVLFDNLGFKNRQGFRKGLGYEQYTIIKIITVSEVQLEEINVYGDELLSRVGKNWEDVRDSEECSYDSLVAPTVEDTNQLSTTTLDIVHAIMIAHSQGLFPSVEQAKTLMRFEVYKASTPATFHCNEYRGPPLTPAEQDSALREDCIYDLPMQMDLNKKDTVWDVINYTIEVGKAILARLDPTAHIFEGQTPIMESIGTTMAGDGSPIIAAQGELRTDEEKKKLVKPVFGGFHLVLEIFKKRASLFDASHLRNMFKLYRTTSGAVEFVMNPSDANQPEREMTQYHLAVYLSALMALIELKFEDMGEGCDSVPVSPDQVIDFMISRAKQNVQAFIILMELRFGELIFMLQRAETKADAKIYCAALKYAMILRTNTNATKYIEMMCNFCVDIHCMSDAERTIYETFILFRKTKNGKNFFSDRFVEWTMRDLRSYLGKFYRHSTTSQLQSLLLQMNEIKEAKGITPDLHTKPSARRMIKLDAAFLEPYVFCYSARAWRGTPQAVAAKPFKKRSDADGNDMTSDFAKEKSFYSMDGKDELYSDILSMVSRGKERTKAYFTEFHIEGEIEVAARSQKQTTLSKPRVTDEGLKEEIKLALSLNFEEIYSNRNIYNSSRVITELNRINEVLHDSGLEEIWPEARKPNKTDNVKALIAARECVKEFMTDNRYDWQADTTTDATRRYEGSQQDPTEIVKEELKDPFFTFDGTQAKVVAQLKVVTFPKVIDNGHFDARYRGAVAETHRDPELMRQLIEATNNM